MSIATVCEAAIATGKVLQKLLPDQLSAKEQELLRSASADGLIHLRYDDLAGKHVATSTREFADDDAAITESYLHAFVKICDYGLVTHQKESVFRLSHKGFGIARKLKNGTSGHEGL
ncbi:MAG: hypothetical protein NTY19_42580 [Planctomycetota bacterium]|nr:hypothetical protein [Planctomycetota bacterium]